MIQEKNHVFVLINKNSTAKKMLKTVEIERPKIEDVFSMLHTLNGAIVKYDIKKSNCEHYVTLWKYGIGWSSQVSVIRDIISSTLDLSSILIKWPIMPKWSILPKWPISPQWPIMPKWPILQK